MPLAIGGHARSDLVLNVVSQLMKTHGTVSRLEGRNLVGTRYLHKCVVDNRIVSGLLLALCPRGNQSMLFALLAGFAGESGRLGPKASFCVKSDMIYETLLSVESPCILLCLSSWVQHA